MTMPRAALGATAAAMLVAGALGFAGCSAEQPANTPSATDASAPAFAIDADFPDPDVVATESGYLAFATNSFGENIQVVGAKRMEAGDGEELSFYVHGPANKVGALVRTKGGDAAAARSLALHLTFARPTYSTRDEVPTELVEAEREILSNSEEVLSKPENVREKIVEGQLNKRFYGESVLTEQTWYRADESTGTVAQYLKEHGIELLDYAWYAVA